MGVFTAQSIHINVHVSLKPICAVFVFFWFAFSPSDIMCEKIFSDLYMTVIRQVLLYGAECWTVRKKEEQILEKTEMRILRRITGVTLRDKVKSVAIRKELGVNSIQEKVREMRIRWYGQRNGRRRRRKRYFPSLSAQATFKKMDIVVSQSQDTHTSTVLVVQIKQLKYITLR